MKDTRKNIKVIPTVKDEIDAIRKELELKTESQALAYLTAMFFDQKKKRITLADHQEYMQAVEAKHNQGSI